MREIKFRAWDGEKMHDARNGSNFYIELTAGGLLLALDHHNHGKTLELMQFTGLKDKNGREIYEGDVVRWEGYTGKVLFWIGKKVSSCPGFYVAVDGDEDELITLDERFEVIGNIYENPELLK